LQACEKLGCSPRAAVNVWMASRRLSPGKSIREVSAWTTPGRCASHKCRIGWVSKPSKRAPGPVWTPLNPTDQPAEQGAKFGQQVPYNRPAQPEEIAPAYVLFASDEIRATSPVKC
jgi:hypothetical protein